MNDLTKIHCWTDLDFYDPLAQFGDTHVYRGAEWTYFWAEDTGRLRRLNNKTDEWDLIFTRTRPQTPLALTQRFYGRRAHGVPTKPRRYRPPNWRRGGPKSQSWAPTVRILDPLRMYLPTLTEIWSRLDEVAPPDGPPQRPLPPLPQADRHVAGVLVQREMAARGMCLVSVVMPNMGAITITSTLHLARVDQLPPDVMWEGDRSMARADYIVASVQQPCPKKPGSAAARRYAKYEVGMTLADYVAAQDERDRGAARGDWSFDESHGYIVLRRPSL